MMAAVMTTLALPAGKYAVACSGGADSVALLLLAHETPGVHVHAVHLNHQTRGAESDADAAFVADLARHLGVPYTVATLDEMLPTLGPTPPANPSAKYRASISLSISELPSGISNQAFNDLIICILYN